MPSANGVNSSHDSQDVNKGDLIGRIGHSGNSFFPHLHFQFMDSCDIATANGLPCAFEEYEIFQNGEWKTVTNEIPTNKDRIRFLPFPKARNREEYTV